MSNIEVGDRVHVQGEVGDVVKIDDHDESRCFHIVLENGGRKRFFDTVTEIEKIVDPFDKLVSGEVDSEWRFDLLTRATELSLAFEYDHLLSLSNSRINLEPYQVEAVHEVVNAPKQRYLIADDVGLGKTIETGMILKELDARDRADRVLIVSPAPLTFQWRREMKEKFDQQFWVYDSTEVQNIDDNIGRHKSPWEYNDRVITSIDYIKQEHVRNELRDVEWDVIVVDEAHKLSKTSDNTTQRYKVGKILSEQCESMLLLSATPHNGDRERFWRLIQLLDKYMFADPADINSERLQDVMVRRGKEKILDADGDRVFKPRKIDTLKVEFTEEEQELYDAVTNYVKTEFNMAKNQKNRAVGFAMIILQKRMVSSVAAIYESLKRRLQALKTEQDLIENGDAEKYEQVMEDPESLDAHDFEDLEERLETAYLKDPELLAEEIETLESLVEKAEEVVNSETDSKGKRLKNMVDKILDEDEDERVLIFTEYRDTLEYLRDTVLKEYTDQGIVTEIHGDVSMEVRENREQLFRKGEKQIMLATDAAGEGINLQFCHLMFNYDLPWNPNRIDQRIGRLHRYGQDRVVQIWHLLIDGTREGEIFERLQSKVTTIEEDLGQMSDVLGSLLENVNLEDLIMQAVTEEESIDEAETELDRAIEERKEMMDQTEELLMSLREFDIEESLDVIEKSQEITFSNDDIERFVRLFFDHFDGRIENTRYKKQYRLFPPTEVVSDDVPKKVERATFDKEIAKNVDPEECDFIAFGHPLLDNIVEFCKGRDHGIGGGASVKPLEHPNTSADYGVLFNWKITLVDETGDVITESLEQILLDENGTMLDFEEAKETDGNPSFKPIENLDELREQAFEVAREAGEKHIESAKEKREREFQIKKKEIKDYFEPRIDDAMKRLESAQDTPKTDEMRAANIGKAEKRLNELKDERDRQLEQARQRKNVVVEAPELLNCALTKFNS